MASRIKTKKYFKNDRKSLKYEDGRARSRSESITSTNITICKSDKTKYIDRVTQNIDMSSESLSITNTDMTELPSWLANSSTEAIEYSPETMHSISFPSIKLNLSDILKLDLSCNELVYFPVQLLDLPFLRLLDLSENKIETLIREEDLEYFQVLESGRSSCLYNLDLSNNFLAHFPQELILKKLSNLRSLDYSSNNLTNNISSESMHDLCRYLPLLETLNLSSNGIENLPEELFNLSELSSLDLSHNKLRKLSESILKLKKLKDINLKGNNLSEPPQEMSNQGLSFINRFFRYFGKGLNTADELKVIVIGHPGAGKTSLIQKLKCTTSQAKDALMSTALAASIESTSGIDISEFILNGIKLKVWDFAGQELYHGVHEMFFSRHALYLLVCDISLSNRSELITRTQYWIDLIQSRVPGSKFFIVGTHKDQVIDSAHLRAELEIDLSQLQESRLADMTSDLKEINEKPDVDDYAEIVEKMATLIDNPPDRIGFEVVNANLSVNVDDGMDNLIKKLGSLISSGGDGAESSPKVGLINALYPQHYATVKEVLHEIKLEKKFVPLEELFDRVRELCSKKHGRNVAYTSSFRNVTKDALHFFTICGEIAWFGDNFPDPMIDSHDDDEIGTIYDKYNGDDHSGDVDACSSFGHQKSGRHEDEVESNSDGERDISREKPSSYSNNQNKDRSKENKNDVDNRNKKTESLFSSPEIGGGPIANSAEHQEYTLSFADSYSTEASLGSGQKVISKKEELLHLNSVIFLSPLWLVGVVKRVLNHKFDLSRSFSDGNLSKSHGIMSRRDIFDLYEANDQSKLCPDIDEHEVIQAILRYFCIIIPLESKDDIASSHTSSFSAKKKSPDSPITFESHLDFSQINNSDRTFRRTHSAPVMRTPFPFSEKLYVVPSLLKPLDIENWLPEFHMCSHIALERRFLFRGFIPPGLIARMIAKMFVDHNIQLQRSHGSQVCWNNAFSHTYSIRKGSKLVRVTIRVFLDISSDDVRRQQLTGMLRIVGVGQHFTHSQILDKLDVYHRVVLDILKSSPGLRKTLCKVVCPICTWSHKEKNSYEIDWSQVVQISRSSKQSGSQNVNKELFACHNGCFVPEELFVSKLSKEHHRAEYSTRSLHSVSVRSIGSNESDEAINYENLLRFYQDEKVRNDEETVKTEEIKRSVARVIVCSVGEGGMSKIDDYLRGRQSSQNNFYVAPIAIGSAVLVDLNSVEVNVKSSSVSGKFPVFLSALHVVAELNSEKNDWIHPKNAVIFLADEDSILYTAELVGSKFQSNKSTRSLLKPMAYDVCALGRLKAIAPVPYASLGIRTLYRDGRPTLSSNGFYFSFLSQTILMRSDYENYAFPFLQAKIRLFLQSPLRMEEIVRLVGYPEGGLFACDWGRVIQPGVDGLSVISCYSRAGSSGGPVVDTSGRVVAIMSTEDPAHKAWVWHIDRVHERCEDLARTLGFN